MDKLNLNIINFFELDQRNKLEYIDRLKANSPERQIFIEQIVSQLPLFLGNGSPKQIAELIALFQDEPIIKSAIKKHLPDNILRLLKNSNLKQKVVILSLYKNDPDYVYAVISKANDPVLNEIVNYAKTYFFLRPLNKVDRRLDLLKRIRNKKKIMIMAIILGISPDYLSFFPTIVKKIKNKKRRLKSRDKRRLEDRLGISGFLQAPEPSSITRLSEELSIRSGISKNEIIEILKTDENKRGRRNTTSGLIKSKKAKNNII